LINEMLTGKPPEREGRKATGLRLLKGYDSGVARLNVLLARFPLLGSGFFIMGQKNTTLILVIIALAAVGITVFAYSFKDTFDLPDTFSRTRDRLLTIEGLSIKFSVNTSIAGNTVSIKYYVPCSTMAQRTNLLKNLPVIKHNILIAMNRPGMMLAMKKRDFDRIRRYSIKVINKYLARDIDTVYLDYFSMHST